MTTRLVKIAPQQADAALDFVRRGGRLVVRTYTRTIIIDRKTLARFERWGMPLLRAHGEGYILRMSRKAAVTLLPGQLEAEEVLP